MERGTKHSYTQTKIYNSYVHIFNQDENHQEKTKEIELEGGPSLLFNFDIFTTSILGSSSL